MQPSTNIILIKKSTQRILKILIFRDGKKYTSGKILQYKTPNPYGNDIVLKNEYDFN